MAEALWHWQELARALGIPAEGAPGRAITGVSIDTRTLQPGDLFVALKDVRDGHEFVGEAFAKGAAAALVREGFAAPHHSAAFLRVPDTLAGLQRLGAAARERLAPMARVVAVTGSAGKTGTKEMLRQALASLGPVHAAEKSFNNHWGVPLSLARMPRDALVGIFEVGMNHAGEIAPLSRLVRPHAAIVTTVEPVHLAHFTRVEEIADEKAAIFAGLEPGGAAILNRDNIHFERLAAHAAAAKARTVSFGTEDGSDVRLLAAVFEAEHTRAEADIFGEHLSFVLGAPGRHLLLNALAVLAAAKFLNASIGKAAAALAAFKAPEGRGARHTIATPKGPVLLIDESYNANPASMRAALASLALVPRTQYPRRIAVLGDMLELGPEAAKMHAALAPALSAAGTDLLFAAGPLMSHLFAAVPLRNQGHWAETAEELCAPLLAAVSGGDVLMVKGSLGSRMGLLAAALRKLGNAEAAGPAQSRTEEGRNT